MNSYQKRNNTIINIAHKLCSVIMFLVILIFMGFLIMLLYSIFNPEAFSVIKVDDMLNAGYNLNFQICNDCNSSNSMSLSSLDSSTKLVLLIRGSLLFIIVFLMVKSLRKILGNMTSYSIFIDKNVHQFRLLFKLTVILSFVCSFNVNFLNDSTNWSFTIPIKIIALAFGFLVLSEIFKEGKHLEEDKNSII